MPKLKAFAIETVEFFKQWGSRMSGAVSVPFVGAAAFSSANYARAIFAGLAYAGLAVFALDYFFKYRRLIESNELRALQESVRQAKEETAQIADELLGQYLSFLNNYVISVKTMQWWAKMDTTEQILGTTRDFYDIDGKIGEFLDERFGRAVAEIYKSTVDMQRTPINEHEHSEVVMSAWRNYNNFCDHINHRARTLKRIAEERILSHK